MLITFKAFLFDLDGTLVDSSDVITRAWKAFGKKYRIDSNVILPAVQGKPTYEAIKSLRPNASDDSIELDSKWLENMEAQDTVGVVALSGAVELLDKLNDMSIPWAIVTSGTKPVATARIRAANLPFPKVLVTPELITQGKPSPEPYLLGAELLGVQAKECVVFEDAPAGVVSGMSAGAQVVGILSQFESTELIHNGAIVCISSPDKVNLLSKTELTIS